uniref:Uncharacterized protein n=1 Tax=viral metagenome TaxID=1070528 RepID=A0A6M3JLD5_9ZZZZ
MRREKNLNGDSRQSLSSIRKQILKQRKIEFKKLSRKPISILDSPVPFKKTNLMRLTEMKFDRKIEQLIRSGTIYELEKKLGVDASTISKWRKLIRTARDAEFFEQF